MTMLPDSRSVCWKNTPRNPASRVGPERPAASVRNRNETRPGAAQRRLLRNRRCFDRLSGCATEWTSGRGGPDPMLRRNLFRAIAAGAAASLRGQPAAAAASQPVTRRIDEMTSREVEFYLKEGGDLVFVPFGPISGHGALIPVGMHGHWAHALSLLLAEEANGLVFPVTWCCYAGATRTFAGTVSFPIAEQVAVLSRIATSLHAAGFRRTVLVGGTTPESTGGLVAARTL